MYCILPFMQCIYFIFQAKMQIWHSSMKRVLQKFLKLEETSKYELTALWANIAVHILFLVTHSIGAVRIYIQCLHLKYALVECQVEHHVTRPARRELYHCFVYNEHKDFSSSELILNPIFEILNCFKILHWGLSMNDLQVYCCSTIIYLTSSYRGFFTHIEASLLWVQGF